MSSFWTHCALFVRIFHKQSDQDHIKAIQNPLFESVTSWDSRYTLSYYFLPIPSLPGNPNIFNILNLTGINHETI